MKVCIRDSEVLATARCLMSCVLRVESISSLTVLRLDSQQLTRSMIQ